LERWSTSTINYKEAFVKEFTYSFIPSLSWEENDKFCSTLRKLRICTDLKAVVIGDNLVGKSSMLLRYIKKTVDVHLYIPTVVDNYEYTIDQFSFDKLFVSLW